MLAKLDLAILRRVMNLAHTIDRKFHFNNYLVAYWIVRFVQFCCVGMMFLLSITSHGVAAISFRAVLYGGCLYAMNRQARRYMTASQKWEKNPGAIRCHSA